jgi:tyrosyl-tRNA synthetase
MIIDNMQKYDLSLLKDAVVFNTVEVIPNDEKSLEIELNRLIEESEKSEQPIRHYIGFEISGQIHIGTGIMSALKIKKLQDAGVKCSLWLADYHTWLNNKLDGNIETIRKVARDYFGPVMLKCCEVVGCNIDDIDLLFAEDIYKTERNGNTFWTYDMMISKNLTLSRVLKSISVTGKDAGSDVDFGTLRYAPLQVADAFFMQAHIVQAGMDQRKCHVLMREVAPKLDDNFALKMGDITVKPIAVHHALLLGLEKPHIVTAQTGSKETIITLDQPLGQHFTKEINAIELGKEDNREVVIFEASKMSKSKPNSCIFVHDSSEEIARKLKKAYCPMPQEVQSNEEKMNEQKLNPFLDWSKKMIYPAGKVIEIKRKLEWGGDLFYNTYEELEQDYLSGKLHPMDLKNGVADCLVLWFAPIREFVAKNPEGYKFLIGLNN